MKIFFFTWGLIILSALLDSYAATIVKAKFNELGHIDYSSFKNFVNYFFNFIKSPLLLTAFIAFISAPVLWFLALNKIDLSLGYPVLVGFHLLFILIFGIFFLGESIDFNKTIGIILACCSLYFFYKA